jgi:hypothetical protein
MTCRNTRISRGFSLSVTGGSGRVIERLAEEEIDVIKKGSEDIDIASVIFRQKDRERSCPGLHRCRHQQGSSLE